MDGPKFTVKKVPVSDGENLSVRRRIYADADVVVITTVPSPEEYAASVLALTAEGAEKLIGKLRHALDKPPPAGTTIAGPES